MRPQFGDRVLSLNQRSMLALPKFRCITNNVRCNLITVTLPRRDVRCRGASSRRHVLPRGDELLRRRALRFSRRLGSGSSLAMLCRSAFRGRTGSTLRRWFFALRRWFFALRHFCSPFLFDASLLAAKMLVLPGALRIAVLAVP